MIPSIYLKIRLRFKIYRERSAPSIVQLMSMQCNNTPIQLLNYKNAKYNDSSELH